MKQNLDVLTWIVLIAPYRIRITAKIACGVLQTDYPEIAVEIVEKWSKEHPQKTILEDFLEKYPNAALNDKGIPYSICTRILGYKTIYCSDDDAMESCIECWNQPME